MTVEQIETLSKKTRGMAQASLDLIESMYAIAEETQPITGRGIGYKLFTAGLIPSMSTSEMQRVYRLLREARERFMVPWDWIVDETRQLERTPSWDDPDHYVQPVSRSYRRDFWSRGLVREGHRAWRARSGFERVRCGIPRHARI